VVNLQVNLQTQPDDLKDLGRRGDEVLDLEGPISNVNRALLVALLLQRGNFARGQLLYKHPPPPNSPPPTNFHALPGGPPPLPGPMVRGPPGGLQGWGWALCLRVLVQPAATHGPR
jgi:hypothetical protein